MKLGSETCKKKVDALLLVTILWCGDCMRLTLNRCNCYVCVHVFERRYNSRVTAEVRP